MRRVARLTLVILGLAACGKKGGGSPEGSGSALPEPSAGPAVPSHAGDDQLRTLPVPELAASSRADNIPDGPLVVIGEKSIVVEGRAMVVVDAGNVDPASLVSDGASKRITPLVNWADSWSKSPAAASSQAVIVAIDPKLPSALATQVIASFLPSNQQTFAFVVRTPDGPGSVPLVVSPPAAAAAAGAPPPSAPDANEPPVQMVLSMTADRAVLWSISGLEGTLASPRLALTPAAGGAWLTQLRDTLTDITKRRWDGRTRPDSEKTIVIIVDGGRPSGDLVNAIAAVRTDAKGNALFPDVQLSTGFDAAAVAAAKKPDPPPEPDKPSRADVAALQEEDIARFADLLAAEGESGITAGDMSARMPGADLNAQISDLRTGGGPAIDGPRSSDLAEVPAGRITVTAKRGGEDTSLDPDAVLRKIQSVYMTGLKRCYKQQLKTDPTVTGPVSMSFSVNETGRVLSGRANAPTPELSSCMEGMIANWRFPVPKDVDGEATTTDFQFKLNLVPE